ncbi:MAG: hypothetical protein ACE5JU_16425 [Candidatus Binatia bacterium]
MANPSLTPEDNYVRIETVYKKLRDNFLAEGHKSSADDVMYELAWQKELLLRDLWQRINGFIMGYGYQPWRFVIFVVVPLIVVFAAIWFIFYYRVIVNIIDPTIKLTAYDYPRDGLSLLAQIWHAIFFSSSVLLGIRFRRQWIVPAKRMFLTIVTLEWAIGIGLYVVFFVLVKSSQFSYIKGLLGL